MIAVVNSPCELKRKHLGHRTENFGLEISIIGWEANLDVDVECIAVLLL